MPDSLSQLSDPNNGLAQLFDALKTKLGQQTLDGLPLLQVPLGEQTTPLFDQVKQRVVTALKQQEEQAKAAGKEFTVDLVRQALFNALGDEGGLNLLQDTSDQGDVAGGDQINISDIQLTNDLNSTQFTLKIGQKITKELQFAENIGLPSLGFSLKNGVSSTIDLGLNLSFGIENIETTPSFFVDFSPENDFQATIETKLQDATGKPLTLAGSLGFLQVTATNNVTPTDVGRQFKGTFTANFASDDDNADADDNRLSFAELGKLAVDPRVQAEGNLKFRVSTALNSSLGINNSTIPSIGLDLNLLKWNYDSNPNPADQKVETGTPALAAAATPLPEVQFNNVTVDLGSLLNFAQPILEKTQKVAKPIVDIANFLNTPLPVPLLPQKLIDLAQTLPKLVGGEGNFSDETLKFIEQIAKIASFADSIPPGTLELGNFDWNGGTVSKAVPFQATQTTTLAATSTDTSWIDELESDTGLNLKLLRSDSGVPTELFKLLLGDKSAQLVEYKTPQLAFNFEADFPPDPGIPIFGPVFLQFFANGGASAQLIMGFDAQGLVKFKEGGFKNPQDIEQGLYIAKPDGDDSHNLSLSGGLGAKAGLNAGFIKVQVGGGVDLTLGLDAKDDADGIPDKKTRIQTLADTPYCALDATGAISLIIFGQVQLNFGFFKVKKRINIPPSPVNLVEFKTDVECSQKTILYNQTPKPDSPLAKKIRSQGIIDRQGNDENNNIKLIRDADVSQADIDQRKADRAQDPNSTLPDIEPELFDGQVRLTGLPERMPGDNQYSNVQLAVINSGKGNDSITMTGLKSSGQLDGEEGNDVLSGGNGDDFLTGGAGSDILEGSAGNNTALYSSSPTAIYVNLRSDNTGYGLAYDGFVDSTGVAYRDRLRNIQNIEGSNYDDFILGDEQNNNLLGGGGGDYLLGGGGDDVLMGGAGGNRGDTLDGGTGLNTTSYIDSLDRVYVNVSDRAAVIRLPFDVSPVDVQDIGLIANSGQSGDAEGDRLSNIGNLQGSVYDDILIGTNVQGDPSVSAERRTDDRQEEQRRNRLNHLDGFWGNDILVGGAAIEVIDGGTNPDSNDSDGETNPDSNDSDWLSYITAPGRVDVSLLQGKGTDGYARNDVIIFEKRDDSTIENLEGSNNGDALEGDSTDNILRGRAGDDRIRGGIGDDTLIGDAGADTLNGEGNGSATLQANSDLLRDGGDTASYRGSSTGVEVNLETGRGRFGDAQGDRLFSIENLFGSDYSDTLIGNGGDNDINPGVQNPDLPNGSSDTVDGGAGRDRLTIDYSIYDYDELGGVIGGLDRESLTRAGATAGTNNRVSFSNIERLFIIGTSKRDVLYGGTDGDVFRTGAGNDVVIAGEGEDEVTADDGDDTVNTDSGNDTVRAGRGNDFVDSGSEDDVVSGDEGNDRLLGNAGNDDLAGGDGNDTLVGSNSFSVQIGEIDTLTGGAGADDFMLGNLKSGFYASEDLMGNPSVDYAVITDFNAKEDSIVLHGCSDRFQGDYFLRQIDSQSLPRGIGIYSGSESDFSRANLIAIVQGGPITLTASNESPTGIAESYFKVVGEPCQVGPK